MSQSLQLASGALDAIPQHIAVLDSSGQIVLTNAAWRRFADSNGTPWQTVSEGANYIEACERATGPSATGAATVAAAFRELLAGTRDDFSMAYPCHSPEVQRWFVMRMMRIPHREQLGVVTSHQEVTEWHLEELRRRTAEEQFGELFAGAPDGMVLVDATGSIVLFNRKAEQLFGRSRQDTVGQPVEVLVPPDLRSVHHQHVRHFAEMNLSRAMGHSSTPLLGVRADGTTFPIEVSLSPLGIASGLAVMAAVRDVSDRMRLEDELRQSQRLETVGRLAGGVAHDFSNLLSVINGTAEMAQLDLPDDSPVLKDLAMIRAAGERAASLIQQLLAFSRRQVVQPALLQLSVVVRALEPLLQRLIGESINVRTQLTSEEWPVYLDPTQADQVLLNLATNARDAMPAGGELTITVANVTLDADATVKAIDLAPGQYVALTVTDTGVGMDEPTRTRIFEPFFTTKTRAKGTGLGLATVFGIAKQCGGSVSCEMSPRGGTTFLVLLPRAPEPGTARSRSVTCPAALSCPSRG